MDSGDLYKGNWVKDSRIGRGLCIFADGTLYQGEWNHDKPDGYGILKTKKGDMFEGDFLQGQLRNGPAKILYANGELYDGNTEMGRRS